MSEELWTPSDGLLAEDPIAVMKVREPYLPPDLEEAGIVLPDLDDGDALEAQAAVAMAELDGDDEGADDEQGDVDDEPDMDDDNETVEEDT
jgi:hypothetical protein